MDRPNRLFDNLSRVRLPRRQNLLTGGREESVRGTDFTHYYYTYQFSRFNELEDNIIVELGRRVTALEQEAINLMARMPGASLSVSLELNEQVQIVQRVRSLENRYQHEFGLHRRFNNVEDILNDFVSAYGDALSNLAQSERDYNFYEIETTFTFSVPRRPRARGKIKAYIRKAIHKHTEGLAKYDRQMSNYCGFYAILYQLARSDKFRQNWTGSLAWFYDEFPSCQNMYRRFKDNPKRAQILCRRLATLMNVDAEEGWDVSTGSKSFAKKFVDFQPKFQIVIYCEVTRQIIDNKKGVLFDTLDLKHGKECTLLFSYTTGHIHLISNIFAYLGRSFRTGALYCANCLCIQTREQHKCLLRPQCDKCLVQFMDDVHETNHSKVANTGLVECPRCERQFYNQVCLDCHKCLSQAKDYCAICERKIYSEDHDCSKFKCRFCSKMVTGSHVCFIEKPDEPKTVTAADAGKDYYAFDLETMTVSDTGKQQVNLIVVCRCFSDQEWIFDDMESFVRWLESLDGEDVCMYAHNLKGFDGRMVFEFLMERSTPPQEIVWNGSKIMHMAYGKVKFRDTLLHLPASLEQLPKMFGLDESKFKKGFFPHRFNRPENQQYAGLIPDEHYYAPEMMSSRKNAEFKRWYESQKEVWFDFHKELVDYCLSDTRILARSIEAYMKRQMDMKPLNPLSKITIASYALAMYRTFFMPKDKIVRLTKQADADIRRSMHGGRTDTRRMLKEWTQEEVEAGVYGKYQDVQSLYPTVQFYDPLPVGRPKRVEFGDNDRQPTVTELENVFGFVCCDITPTRYLHHPIIVEVSPETDRLVAALKPLKNVVVPTPELHLALKNGYRVDRVYWYYSFESSTELFKPYFREFIKNKLEASGVPYYIQNDADWEEYRLYHKNELGIELEKPKMVKNPSKKTGAKLLCNSLWGKFGERMEKMKNEVYKIGEHNDSIITLENRWMDNDVDIMHRRQTIDRKHLIMVYKILNSDLNFVIQGKHSRNVALASMVTSHARCRLWQELNKLGERVLYHDTDSIIYERRPGQYNIPEGRYLGEWECETDGIPITKFVSTGPKCYSYVLQNGKSTTKVKGFSLNSKNSSAIHYDAMKSLVKGDLDTILAETTQFKYNLQDGSLTVNKIEKLFKSTYEKGFIDKKTWKVYPFGWNQFPDQTRLIMQDSCC
jgi:hypothetical protein